MILIISIQKRKRLFHTGYSSAKSIFLRQGSLSIIGKAEKPLPHNNNTMKKLILARGVLAASLFCCMSLGNTACVNRIDEESEAEIEEGTTPITFSIKMEKASTKVTNTAFEKETEWACLQPLPPAPSRENGILTIWPWNIRKAPHWFPKDSILSGRRCVTGLYQLPPLPNRRGSCRYTRSSRICADRPEQ